jgi:DNA ligase-associated metallophosphoesterase
VQNPFPHIIRHNTFWISSERCLYWEETNTLIVSDLHLGKSGHFRKEGIAVPQGIYKDDLQRLMAQLYFFKADRLIIVGDLTHSTANKELDLFKRWRKDFSSLRVELIKGNHDILADDWYKVNDIKIYAEDYTTGDFCFRHEPGHKPPALSCGNDAYTFSGHVHPGVVMRGKGKQSLRMPCFYFTPEYAILPAFSRFTGTYLVDPADGENVYGIAGNQLVQIA